MGATDRLDLAQIALMVVAGLLAWALPFGLVVLAYVLLGPAHYLTQLRWMHARGYGVGAQWLLGVYAGLTLLALAVPFGWGVVPLALALGVSLALVWAPAGKARAAALGVAVAAALGATAQWAPDGAAWLALLVPTLVHVSLFTGIFLWRGAHTNRRPLGYVAVAIFVVVPIVLLLVPPAQDQVPTFWDGKIAPWAPLAVLFEPLSTTPGLAAGYAVVSFAYLYHYLNWFSKTGLIGWHKGLRPGELWALVAAYLTAVGLYWVDLRLGFAMLLALSYLHVVAEFPLNIRALGVAPRHG